MAKKKNKIIMWVLIIIAVLILLKVDWSKTNPLSDLLGTSNESSGNGGSGGGGGGGGGGGDGGGGQNQLSISVLPKDPCKGDNVIGYITSNMPRASCIIQYRFSNLMVWKSLGTVTLDASGKYNQQAPANNVGGITFRVVCNPTGNAIVSNEEKVTVKDCDFVLGCNDNDYTQTNFDDSILFPGHCIDKLGQHNDACTAEGLLDEWSCPLTGDTCSHTFINCKSFAGPNAVCSNGQCLSQPECTQNVDCLYSHGEGYVCRNSVCVQVTGVNCNSIAQEEEFQMGIWNPLELYSQSCYEFCVYNCGKGCNTHATGGTLGLCCGYNCI